MKNERPEVRGLKYLDQVMPVLSRLHDCGTERDTAGNRLLHYDNYAALLLIYFLSPTITSLRGLHQASSLHKVQLATGVPNISLGTLSGAPAAFDPALLRQVLREIASDGISSEPPADHAALRDLVAVDGSLLRALPRMVWASYRSGKNAVKLHLAFEVFRGPTDATITTGKASERKQLTEMLLAAEKLYVLDRGYESYELLAKIRAAKSSFVARLQEDCAFEVKGEDRPLTDADRAAGVVRDVELSRLGTSHHKDWHKGETLRLVIAEYADEKSGEVRRVCLVTDRMDLSAELVAVAYRYRWSVELFFRWLKCVPGCRHLLSHSEEGVAIQVYMALIASVLLGRLSGRKPDKRTFEMFCHFFSGLATEEELQVYLEKRCKAESSA